MSKSLVVKRHDGFFARAATPADGKHIPESAIPHYNGEVKAQTWPSGKPSVIKAHVTAGNHGFEPKGGKVDAIRHVPDSSKGTLAAIDLERYELTERLENLKKLEQQVLQQAFEGGRPVTVTEVQEWKEQRKANR